MNVGIQPFRVWLAAATLMCILLTGAVAVGAQAVPTAIGIGENQLGSIAAPNTDAPYSLSVGAPQSIEVQVLGVTPGFAPAFRVLDPGGVRVFEAANPEGQSVAQGSAALFGAGTYSIVVSGVNGAAGQFLISVQAGEPITPALVLGENQIGTLAAGSSTMRYSLMIGAPQSVNLQVLAVTPGFAPAFRVMGVDDSVLIDVANASGQNNAKSLVTLPQAFTYIVEVRSANNSAGQYVISAQPNAPLPTATPIASPVPTSAATPEVSSTCSATPNSSQAVNVRFGPGTGYGIVGSLAEGESAPVIGRLADGSWFQIDRGNASVGWVSVTVVMLNGDCSSVPVVVPPPPPLPTQPAEPTQPSDAGGQPMTPQATTSRFDPLGDIDDVTEFLTAEPTNNSPLDDVLGDITDITTNITAELPDFVVDGQPFATSGKTADGSVYVMVGAWAMNVNPNSQMPTDLQVMICIEVPGGHCRTVTVSLTEQAWQRALISVPPELFGVYQVRIYVDPYNAINESNEGNNTKAAVLEMRPPPAPIT